MQSLRHPGVHQAWQQWSEDQTLHITSVYFNPFRSKNRLATFQAFIDQMQRTANVVLHIVEVAFGDRPFEVTTEEDVQLRTNDVLWLKENAINLGVAHFPLGWKYGGYVDGDLSFTRQDWALEAIHQLQLYSWVQLFSGYGFLSHEHRPLTLRPSFAYAYHNYFGGTQEQHNEESGPHSGYHQPPGPNKPHKFLGAVGGAWSFTNKAFEAVGGMLDFCILGAADWYMAFGLIGCNCGNHIEMANCKEAYITDIVKWQEKAYKAIKGNISYIDSFVTHNWHGDVSQRGYDDRWQILTKFDFNPAIDIVKDRQGLIRWAGNKHKLESAVKRYFISRNEDNPNAKFQPLY